MPLKLDKSWANFVAEFNESSQYLQSFSWSKDFGFNKISSCFISLMTIIFCFTRIWQILSTEPSSSVSVHWLIFGKRTAFLTFHRNQTLIFILSKFSKFLSFKRALFQRFASHKRLLNGNTNHYLWHHL